VTRHAVLNPDGSVASLLRVKRTRARGASCGCGAPSESLCDGPSASDRRKTCDAPLCAACAHRAGGDLDFCGACRLRAPARVAGALVAYTDGSGTLAETPSGAGVVVYDGDEVVLEAARHLGNGTNNHAEISAVRVALWVTRESGRPLVVRTDSTYTIDALVGAEPHRLANNAALIRATRKAMAGRQVVFQHVRGHRGLRGNERADELAGLARTALGRRAPSPAAGGSP